MPKKHTIETLTSDVNRRFAAVNRKLDIMRPQVEEMHDFIIDSKAFERGRGQAGGGSININKDVWGIIKWLIIVLLAVAGIKVSLP